MGLNRPDDRIKTAVRSAFKDGITNSFAHPTITDGALFSFTPTASPHMFTLNYELTINQGCYARQRNVQADVSCDEQGNWFAAWSAPSESASGRVVINHTSQN